MGFFLSKSRCKASENGGPKALKSQEYGSILFDTVKNKSLMAKITL